MSIATLKRKTNSQYAKVHSHGRDGASGFSINGSRRGIGYIGKDQKISAVFTPFRGTLPMGLDGNKGTIVYRVGPGTDIRAHQYQTVKPSVVSSREQMNRERWCCADIVRTQSGIEAGSQDLYIARKSAANVCVVPTNKPTAQFNPSCKTSNNRLHCENNYTKDSRPIDSSLRTLNVQKQCARLAVDPSKLFITNGTSHIKHVGC